MGISMKKGGGQGFGWFCQRLPMLPSQKQKCYSNFINGIRSLSDWRCCCHAFEVNLVLTGNVEKILGGIDDITGHKIIV